MSEKRLSTDSTSVLSRHPLHFCKGNVILSHPRSVPVSGKHVYQQTAQFLSLLEAYPFFVIPGLLGRRFSKGACPGALS